MVDVDFSGTRIPYNCIVSRSKFQSIPIWDKGWRCRGGIWRSKTHLFLKYLWYDTAAFVRSLADHERWARKLKSFNLLKEYVCTSSTQPSESGQPPMKRSYWATLRKKAHVNTLKVNHLKIIFLVLRLKYSRKIQYRGLWCPGPFYSQVISSHGIDQVGPRCSYLQRGRVWINCAISLFRNDRKWNYV